MKPETRNILSVIAGSVVMAITGWALFPILKTAVINAYTVSAEQGVNPDRIQLSVINLLWVSISAFTGGFFAARIAAYRKIFHALLAGTVAAVFLLLLQIYLQRFYITDIIILLMIIAFTLMGGMVAALLDNNNQPD
jgi:hypothetical protein